MIAETQLKAIIKALGSNHEVLKTLGLNYDEREDGGDDITKLYK